MSIDLLIYGDTGEQFRVFGSADEPTFALVDACVILGLSNPTMAAKSLNEADLSTTEVSSGGQRRQINVVNESGLYELIFQSRKPEAKKFRRWITGTVLPALRKTGTYSTAPALTGPALMAAALIEAQSTLAAKDAVIAELEPKAELAENYLTASAGSRLVGEAAKILGMKEKQLRAFLLAEKLIFVKHATCGNVLYDHYSDFAPHFEARETVVNHTWGSCNHYTLRITPRGIDLIRKRLRDQEEAA